MNIICYICKKPVEGVEWNENNYIEAICRNHAVEAVCSYYQHERDIFLEKDILVLDKISFKSGDYVIIIEPYHIMTLYLHSKDCGCSLLIKEIPYDKKLTPDNFKDKLKLYINFIK
jgi:hypothetical protein